MSIKIYQQKKSRPFFPLLFLLLLGTGWSQVSFGQLTPTYAYPGGASSNAFPFSSTSSNRVQGLYMANQFSPSVSAGNITDVYFLVSSAATNAVYTNLTISLGMTSISTLTTGPWNTGLTQCYSVATLSIPTAAAGSWVRFQLQTPFYWDGVSNLIVDAQSQSMTGTGFTVANATIAYNGRLYGNYAATTGTAGTQLAGIGFNMAPATPCVAPPTPGTSVASTTNACQGSAFTLSLTGNSLGLNQTYQWQTATTAAGPWTNLGTAAATSFYNATATTTLYYRAAVTCGTSTVYSTPVLVTVPALFPGGTYTINSALPTSGTNYQTFTAAVNAISCGIAGPVVFNVAPTSGPYNEQVTIPAINTTATNTVTFNCNNRILTYTNTTNTTNYAVLRLDGADYIRIKKLTVVPGATGSYGYGIVITNDADKNIIDSCLVDNGLTQTSSLFAGIVVGGSATSATASTLACDSNIISNNEVIGGYYCTVLVGPSGTLQQYNQFLNNKIHDYYVYGLYMLYNNNHQIIGNEFHRTNRTAVSTFYGIVNTSGNLNGNISMNSIHDPFGAVPTNTGTGYFLYNAASATAGTENVFSNNIVYNMNGAGSHYCMYSVANSSKWYYNTISADYTAATAGSTYGYYQSSSYTGITVKNNIISVTRGGTGAKYAVYHAGSGYATVMNNNDYYVTGATNYLGYNGTNQLTLAAWQAATSQDAASMSVNPGFFAPTVGDLTPTNLSMDNIGTPIPGITTDITGFQRSATTPDAGAFEFNNPCFPPSGLTATSITTNSANLNWSAPAISIGYQYVISTSSTTPTGAGTPVTGTSVIATGLSAGTTYYLYVRTRCGSNSFSTWVSIPFITCTQAAITPLSSVIFCTGGSVTLTANPGSSYQWLLNGASIAGATASSYTTSTPGNYSVTVATAATGCISTSVPVTVQVGTPPATITPSGAVSICPGVPATLSALSGVGLTYQWMLNGTNIPGATSATYSAGTAGNYTVFISSGPNCNATTITPTTISINPTTPASITPPAQTSVCPGNSFTLAGNTGTGLSYQWLLNGNNVGGATSSTYTGVTPGSYSVKVTSGTTGCSSISSAVAITAAPVPNAQINAPSQVTGCDSATLTAASGAGYNYQWIRNGVNITGATGQTYSAPTTGNYSVKVTSTLGCPATSAVVAVTVNPSPSGFITYNAPLVFCQGSGVVLNTTTENGVSYQWMINGTPIPGASGSTYIAGTTGSFALSMTNNFGCSKLTQPVQITVNPLPQPVVTLNNDSLSTGLFSFYQWSYNNQSIGGANYRNYIPGRNGAYSVTVTDSNGCTNTSAIYFVNSLGVGNTIVSGTDIKVYPNPASSYVTVDNTGRSRISGISVVNAIGATVYQAAAETQLVTINTAALPAGIYTIRIYTNAGTVVCKLELIK